MTKKNRIVSLVVAISVLTLLSVHAVGSNT